MNERRKEKEIGRQLGVRRCELAGYGSKRLDLGSAYIQKRQRHSTTVTQSLVAARPVSLRAMAQL
jgi:hypothetical protein